MNDLTRAIELLHRSQHTLVLVRGNVIITSDQRGISPMLDILSDSQDVSGFAAADRIIGKAAAMLFQLAGIFQLHGDVASQSALEFCRNQGLDLSYDTLVPVIVNRQGDGPCPMEATVATIQDAHEAFPRLLHQRTLLQNRRHADTP